MEFVKRADPQDASYAFEPLRKLARRFPVVKRHVRRVLRLARAAEYRTRRRLRWLPKIRGSPGARLGVYVAYFDAAEIFGLHLTSFRQNTAGAFNYYVMKNCTTFSEARRFDAIVSEYGFPTVFTTWPPHEPFSHDDSLQRMVDQTTDEVIVVCDVDAFPVMRGWDDFILRELGTKDAVGAVVHMPDRAGPRTVLHPCFLAFRRSFLEAHGLQVRRHGNGDPCGRITEYLLANGRFHEGCVTPLLPTAHEMELFPGFTHDPAFGSRNLRHGFGTTYGGLALHLWFWRIVARRRPVVGADGTVLVGVEQMEKVLESLRSRFGGAEHASSAQLPRDVPRRRVKPSLFQRANARRRGLADLALALASLWERASGRHPRPGRRALGSDRCVVATVANDAFTEYVLVLLHSIREHNAWFTRFPLRVFWSPQLSPLSPQNQARIREAHPDTTFVSVDGAPYERYREHTPPRLMAALLTLETFGIRDADRVVFLDADMVCLGDLTDLFVLDVDLAACPTGSSRAVKETRAGTVCRRIRVNTGVLVIGKRYLNDATQRRLAGHSSGQFADQDVLNGFLRRRSVYCLDHRFNYHAEFFWRGDETDVRLLHYAGTKPLDAPDLPRMRPWFAARERQRRAP